MKPALIYSLHCKTTAILKCKNTKNREIGNVNAKASISCAVFDISYHIGKKLNVGHFEKLA